MLYVQHIDVECKGLLFKITHFQLNVNLLAGTFIPEGTSSNKKYVTGKRSKLF